MIEFSRQSSRWAPLIWILTIVVAFLVPIGVKIFFDAPIGIFPLVMIIIAVSGPIVLHQILGERITWLRYVSGIPALVLAVIAFFLFRPSN